MQRHIFECIDAHTCGNPVRLVKSGVPDLQGQNMSEKRQYFLNHYDWIRRGLMFEPRGHDMMSGSVLFPPHEPENDCGVLFLETSGCLPMCGHGAIGTATIAIEEGLVDPAEEGRLRMETPAGLVTATYDREGDRVSWVEIRNVASYLALSDVVVDHPGLGKLKVDVAYGGNFYAIVDPQENFRDLSDFSAAQLVTHSRSLRSILNEFTRGGPVHPLDPTISGITHVMWTGPPLDSRSSGRNAVFYAEKAIDRSPCGTGTSARLAQMYARGRWESGVPFLHESIIGSVFEGRIEEDTRVGPHPGIIPSIRGWARIHGYNRIIIDEADPYAHGFQVL